MLRAIDIVSIPVRDQNAALKFYTEKLGFKVATDQYFDDGKQRWI
jgi:catechol 2,3-dioxygenase-like lactoylglutathione lyase family enzyme